MARLIFRFLPGYCLLALVALGLASCGPNATGSANRSTPSTRGYTLTHCDGQSIPTSTAAAPAAPSSIYAGAVSGKLYAFSSQDGSVRWCNQFSITQKSSCPPGGRCPPSPQAIIGKPTIAGSVLYVCVSGYGGDSYALNASDGSLRWKRETGCGTASIPFADYAQPILANQLLYSGKYALDPASGEIRWQMPMDATVGAVVDGVIYAYTEDTLFALSPGTNAIRWQYKLDAPIGALPIVAGEKVYVGDMNGNSPPAVTPGLPDAHALDATTGALLWSYPSGIVSSISQVAANGIIYFGADSRLYALDATTGALLWQYQTGSSVHTPLIWNSSVYFTADGAYALNDSNGALLWHNALGTNQSTTFTESTILNNRVYLGQTDGSGNSTLYALDASSGAVLWQHGNINQMSPPVVS